MLDNQNQIQFYSSPKPFSDLQVTRQVVPGTTIEEMVGLVVSKKIRNAEITCKVFIDGHEISPGIWHCVKPKPGTKVTLNVVPAGGKGKKNPLIMILMIVVLVVATIVTGGALAPALGAAFAAGTTGAAIAGAVIGVIGNLAIQALAPPPKQPSANKGSSSGPAENPTQFIEGAQNTISPYGVVPICLGTNRMFPLQTARPYTETVDNNQYVRQLFTYGWGEKLLLSEMKIGETDITEFDNIDIEHKLNGDLHNPTGLFPDDVFQDDYGILLRQADGYTLRTTRANIDEAVVDFTFAQGLTYYNSKGGKNSVTVKLDIQYAIAGSGSWSPSVEGYKSFSSNSLGVDDNELSSYQYQYGNNYVSYRKDLVVLDKLTGVSSILKGTYVTIYYYYGDQNLINNAVPPPLPSNKIRLSTLSIESTRNWNHPLVTTSIIAITDDRDTSLFGNLFETSNDFKVTISGAETVNIAAGKIKSPGLEITDARSEALRKSYRLVFPTTGTYDIRIKRTTTDATDEKVFDKVSLTAIKSFTHRSPVKLQGVNGTAIRIKATDQLNGSIDQFNAIVSNIILDYDEGIGSWSSKVTSNPASIYRYVLQCAANAKALPDSKIDLENLEDWHTYCINQGYTYNRVIDYRSSVDDILADIAAAGSAAQTLIDGKRGVVIDRLKDDIRQVVTPRNSWGYSGEMTYPELPHAIRVNFRNAEKGYAQDELIVYADGYSAEGEVAGTVGATIYETLSLQSCVDSDLAYKTTRRHFADALLRRESHSFMMDVENLSFTRGARIKFISDVAKIGIGQGRITSVILNDDETLVTGFSIDDVVSVPTLGYYFTRIRLSDGVQLYKEFVAVVGQNKTFDFVTPFTVDDAPQIGDLSYFVEAGKELDLVVVKIEPAQDFTAKIICADYAPAIFDAENGLIPPFQSNITTPLEFIRPLPPVLIGEIQSDESVMLRNSDGSFLPRAIIMLQNLNEGSVSPNIKIRVTGASAFNDANILESNPEKVILTGLEDGKSYDIQIRYRRANSTIYSVPLTINGFKFIGASTTPPNVTGFKITVVGDTAIFNWDKSEAIDHKSWEIRYSAALTGATYATAQTIAANVYNNSLTIPFQPGTYFIKDEDLTGNKSVAATQIVTFDPGLTRNVIETLIENPTFAGTKDNTSVDIVSGALRLGDTDNIGYYYFDNSLDLTGIFSTAVSASILAYGGFANDIMEDADIFLDSDLFAISGTNDIMPEPDFFAMADVFGIGADAWEIELQYRITSDDPTGTPTWTDWQPFVAGNISFWGIEFRVKLSSFSTNVSPFITELIVIVDMPDRIERGEDLAVSNVSGVTVIYPYEFKNNPAVNLTLQDGADGDRYDYISKTPAGFTVKVFNVPLASYVNRSIDYISSGYGRLNS